MITIRMLLTSGSTKGQPLVSIKGETVMCDRIRGGAFRPEGA